MNIQRIKKDDIDYNALFGEIIRNKTRILGADIIYLGKYKKIIFEFEELEKPEIKTIEQWSHLL